MKIFLCKFILRHLFIIIINVLHFFPGGSHLVFGKTLQVDIANLTDAVRRYRTTLSTEDMAEFDSMWGLDSNGFFLTGERVVDDDGDDDDEKNASKTAMQLWFPTIKIERNNVHELVVNDLTKVRCSIEEELKNTFMNPKVGNIARGQRLLYLFQKDLMPGVQGKILDSTDKRVHVTQQSHSFAVKVATWILIASINSVMVFYIFLFSLRQSSERQNAWFNSFMIWLVMEIFVIGTAAVYVIHFLIPSLIMKDLSKVRAKLMDSIRRFNKAVREQKHVEKKKKSNTAALKFNSDSLSSDSDSASNSDDDDNAEFNVAAHLFVSYRIAKNYSELKESKIILQFSTQLPHQSYLRSKSVRSAYNKKFAALTRSLSTILMYVVTNLVDIPPAVQDVIVQLGSSTLLGYVAMFFMELYNTSPVLIAIPIIGVAILVHFLIVSSKADRSAVLPLLDDNESPERSKGSDESKFGNEKEEGKSSALRASAAVELRAPFPPGSSASSALVGGGAVGPAVSGSVSKLKNRRQSVAEGASLIRQMQLQTPMRLSAEADGLNDTSRDRAEDADIDFYLDSDSDEYDDLHEPGSLPDTIKVLSRSERLHMSNVTPRMVSGNPVPFSAQSENGLKVPLSATSLSHSLASDKPSIVGKLDVEREPSSHRDARMFNAAFDYDSDEYDELSEQS